MPTFRNAVAIFDAASAAGRIPNRKTGGMGPLKPSRRDPILCNVRAAVRHALRATHGDRFVPDEVLDATELAPYLATLPLHAHLDATEDERGDPGKERSNVALFVSVVTGQDAVRAPKVVAPARVLPAWRTLYDALDAHVRKDLKKRRSLRRAFVAFAEMAVANGVAMPEQVPDDYGAILQWGGKIGVTKKEVHYRLGGWRAALDAAGATTLAYAYDVVDRRGLGIRSMPDYPERLRAAGYAGAPRDASAQKMVGTLAPKLGVALDRVIGQGRAAGPHSVVGRCRDRRRELVGRGPDPVG